MHRVQLGPANRVTLTRAVLAGVVAVLTVAGLVGEPQVALIVAISTVALVLDAVDGYVARRTDTATAFGARFDMEVDAFLIAVLSVHVAPYLGWWVLAIGAMRYAYVLAGRVLPWLRRPVAPALLGQGGRRDPGHRADRRRLPSAARSGGSGRPRHRAAAAPGVVRERRLVAVATPS